jgi:flagellar biosynthesis protein FlhA
MDGASKFVSWRRGRRLADFGHQLDRWFGHRCRSARLVTQSDAGRIYTLLTIGDGLVAQIPSLFLSLATAIIVTRVTTSESMTEQATTQLSNPDGALYMAAGIMAILRRRYRHAPFGVYRLWLCAPLAMAWGIVQRQAKNLKPNRSAGQAAQAASDEPKELDWDDVDQVDLIGLEIGYGLIPLVNPETGGQLMSRVKGVRKKLSAELGFLVQPVRIRDALNIDPDAYHIVLKGVARGKGQIKVGRELAINPGQVYGPLEGQATQRASLRFGCRLDRPRRNVTTPVPWGIPW